MMIYKAVFLSFVLAKCFFIQGVCAVGTDDQVNANLDYGTFQDPSSNVRPRFRYWPPDASVNLSQVADDVREAGRVGAGGIELLGYYLYGGPHPTLGGYVPVDWTTYGWGTPAWKELQDTALSTASENGLLIDLSLGADQGAGVPAPANSDGLLWELIAYNVTIAQGGTFDGILPGWGSGDFVSASSALILSSVNNTATGGMNITISANSLTDITSSVSSTGYVTANFPANTTGLYYTLFAYYQRTSGYREVISPTEAPGAPQSPVENYVQNGSWVVDHFSTLGAQVVIDFWEEYLLTNSTKDLIKQVGNYMWEDSQEYGTGVQRYWTPQFSSAFLTNRGYSINKYLPLVPLVDFPGSPTTVWYTDEADGGASHVYDYRQTLTELNQLYLQALTEWSEQSLDIQFSAQVAYNLPMDMLANVPYVNAPECESLGFSDLIDAYRQFAGPANLAGKRIVSSELGAVYGKAYQQTIPDILFHIKRSVAGSINQFVLHGYPYSANYPNTTWPGFTTFAYLFSEMHGRHQPAWDFYSDFLDFTSRTQYIAQTGVPKIDLAFWSKLDDYVTVPTRYDSSDLEEAGYSYEYLSPDNFVLPEAYVADAVFAPNRQAFKALIVRANDTLTPFGVTKLAEFAENGLPIIFSGGVPSTYGSYNQTGVASAKETITQLTSLENVHTVSYTGLAASLSSLSILPRTVVNANSTWYTYWRTDNASATEYIYIYNDANTVPAGQGFSTGNITFATTGTPYTYDAWTGSITPINIYQQTSTTTTIPFQLAGNQSTIVAFKLNETQSSPYIQQCSSNILSTTTSTSNNSITLLRTYDQQSQTCQLSTGTSITLNPMLTPAFELSNWTLIIESWNPPTDLSDIQTIAVRTNTSYNLPTLIPWNQIPDVDLSNTSGRGYYSTQFQWPPSTSTSNSNTTTTTIGAIINLGSIFHTARLFINGQTVPPLDITSAKSDITSFLNDGINYVEVVVSTPLSNTLRSVWDEIKSSGVFATDFEGVDPPASVGYGLLDTVVVSPYESVQVFG